MGKKYIMKATKDYFCLKGASAKDTLKIGTDLLKFTASRIGAKCAVTIEGEIFRVEIIGKNAIDKEEQDEQI